MANLPLAFAEMLAGGVLITAAATGDSIGDVMKGQIVAQPLPGSSSASSSTAAAGSSSAAGGVSVASGHYTNPMPKVSGYSRVDQGVDATITGNFLALGRSQIVQADESNPGWRGGGYIAAKLLDGPYAGSIYYVAEGVKPLVRVGETVAAGTPLATPVRNPYNGIVGNLETGWADPSAPGRPLAQSTGGYLEGASTAAGVSFNALLRGLGAAGGHVLGQVLGNVSSIGQGAL